MAIIKCKCNFDFEFDTEGYDPSCVDIEGLAIEATVREIEDIIKTEGYDEFGENYIEVVDNPMMETSMRRLFAVRKVLRLVKYFGYKYIIKLDHNTLYACRKVYVSISELLEDIGETYKLPQECVSDFDIYKLEEKRHYSVDMLTGSAYSFWVRSVIDEDIK